MGAIPGVFESIEVFKNSFFAEASNAVCSSFKLAVVRSTGMLLTDPTKVGLINSISNPDVTRTPVNAMQLVADSRVPRLSIGLLNCK